jgi:hypothetical protein
MLTLLVAFGALVIAALVAAALAPGEVAAERPFLRSQCMARPPCASVRATEARNQPGDHQTELNPR